MEFLFKNLVVWQKSMELVKRVYALVKTFPVEERYALSDQLRRAVTSIPSNIAEGNGRAGNKDYAHFIAIARGSLYETLTQLEIARSLGYIGEGEGARVGEGEGEGEGEELEKIEELGTEIARMLAGMLKKFGALQEN